jgi:MFS transporter, ACS family, D-galactonate transporter
MRRAVGKGFGMTNVRWRIIVLLSLALMISYIDRINLSFVAPEFMRSFNIGPAEMGVVLSVFLWTYFLLQVPAGLATDRWGIRYILGCLAILWGGATMMTSTASGQAALVGWRALLGVGESAVSPGSTKALGYWMPDKERGLAGAIIIAGIPIGTFLGSPLIGWILANYGWRAVFIGTGLLAVVWGLGWMAYYRQPGEHAAANAAERQYIADNNTRLHAHITPVRVGWGQLLRNRNVIGLSFGHATLLFNLYFFLSWLPTFLVEQHHLTILKTGFVGAIPWFFGLLGALTSGYGSDRLVRRGWRPIMARKIFMGAGMIMCMTALLSVFTTSLVWTVTWLSLAVFGLLMTNGVVWSANADIAPEAQGASVSGLQNFIGNIGGLLAPIVTGALVQLTGSWVAAMASAAIVAMAGAALYLGLLSADARLTWLPAGLPATAD